MLKQSIQKVDEILASKQEGDRLTPLEVHDIICHIADCVVSGGIRRSALICLFDNDDAQMLNCKGRIPVDVVGEPSDYVREMWNGDQMHQEKRYNVEIIYRGKNRRLDLSEWEFNDLMAQHEIPGMQGRYNTVQWYMFEAQRARSNNSAVFYRKDVKTSSVEKKAGKPISVKRKHKTWPGS